MDTHQKREKAYRRLSIPLEGSDIFLSYPTLPCPAIHQDLFSHIVSSFMVLYVPNNLAPFLHGWPLLHMKDAFGIGSSANKWQLQTFYLPVTRSVTYFIFI